MLDKIYKETGIRYNSVNDIGWQMLSYYKNLSEDFIREFQNKVNWGFISTRQKLSEAFIREFQNKVDWENVSIYQKLSENFIRKFKNEVDWLKISKYQKLSEGFIRKFKNEVDWDNISKYQKLSENFIRKFKNEVDWYNISKYQKLSKGFIKEFNLKIDADNWLYKYTKFKKKQVIETGLYECHDDYFIAYKAIRSDRYSHYNFQYQYLKGGVYECHCDCTENENSFGLSAWTQEQAKQYNNTGIIVRVKIKYEDVGRIVHDGGKIRCSKFEVLD